MIINARVSVDDDVSTLPDRIQVRLDPSGVVRVLAGVRVGVLFVRPACWNEAFQDCNGRLFQRAGVWVVDVPTCDTAISFVREFWTAMLIADEVSRFAAQGVEAISMASLTDMDAVLGPVLCDWLEYVVGIDALPDELRHLRPLAVRPWCESLGIQPPRVAPLHDRGRVVCDGAS